MSESQALAKKEEGSLVFQLFDKLDDKLVIEEIQQRVVNTWVYHFNQKGNEVWGLSKKGVDQALLEMEKLGIIYEEESVECEPDLNDPNYMLFSAKVKRYRYDRNLVKIDMGAHIGNKRQSVVEHLKDGKTRPDPFWYEKGAAKALRNAKMRTIPTEIESKIITLAKQEGRTQTVGEEDISTNGKESKPATEKQLNYIKGLVSKKLKGDWQDVLKEWDFSSKEELELKLTVEQGNDVIKWLESLKEGGKVAL